MKGLAFFVLGAVIGLIVGALWIGPERVGELSDQDAAAINSAVESYTQAFETNDWAAFATLYAEDAVVMPPNAPVVQGRAALLELTATWPPITTFSVTIDEIDGCRDLAFSRGGYTFSATLAPAGGRLVADRGGDLELGQPAAAAGRHPGIDRVRPRIAPEWAVCTSCRLSGADVWHGPSCSCADCGVVATVSGFPGTAP